MASLLEENPRLVVFLFSPNEFLYQNCICHFPVFSSLTGVILLIFLPDIMLLHITSIVFFFEILGGHLPGNSYVAVIR